MEKIYKNIVKEIDKEISQLTDDNNFRHGDYWFSINSNIKKKYRIWKSGNEELDMDNHDYYHVLAKKENFIEEEFRKLYENQSITLASICQKYKVKLIIVVRAAKYLNLNKRIRKKSPEIIKAREDFVNNGYLEDLKKGVKDKDLMQKYNLTKFKQKQMKEFCLLHKNNC